MTSESAWWWTIIVARPMAVLLAGQGLTARECAQAMGKTTGAVQALLHRALAAVRRLLERETQPDTAIPDATQPRPVGQAGS